MTTPATFRQARRIRPFALQFPDISPAKSSLAAMLRESINVIFQKSGRPMSEERQYLEARIVALEYAFEVLTDCLSDRKLVDPAKIARLFQNAASDPETGRTNPDIPRALTSLGDRL